MVKIEKMLWDSEFFGLQIGSANLGAVTEEVYKKYWELRQIEPYDLVYFFEPIEDVFMPVSQIKNLVDTKIVLSKTVGDKKVSVSENIVEFRKMVDFDIENIYDLGISSGKYSRFNLDKNFPHKSFSKLYKKWIDNSLNYSFADDVFLFVHDDLILGIITAKYDRAKATIGLIAVNENYRGQSIGSSLIDMAEHSAKSNGCSTVTVATQYQNTLALRFYEKNGFTISESTNVYHIWK